MLQLPLLFSKRLHLIRAVLVVEFLHDIESFSQVVVLLLELEDLSIRVIQRLGLPLNGLSQRQIALQHLLHHVHSVDDPLSDGILRLVDSTVRLLRVLVPLVTGDVSQLVSLVSKELVHLFLVLDNSLRDDLPMFDTAFVRFLIGELQMALLVRVPGQLS